MKMESDLKQVNGPKHQTLIQIIVTSTNIFLLPPLNKVLSLCMIKKVIASLGLRAKQVELGANKDIITQLALGSAKIPDPVDLNIRSSSGQPE